MNIYFICALVTNFLGPVVDRWVSVKPAWARFFDGLILASIIGLVSLHILPESFLHGGILTSVAMTIGLLGPLAISRFTRRNECEIQKPFLFFTVIGFIAHNMLDGAALLAHPNSHAQVHFLALAVVIHRSLESLALWRTLSSRMGKTSGILALMAMGLAMTFGYFFADQIVSHTHTDVLHIMQALAGGLLLHVLLHPHHVEEVKSHLCSHKVRLFSKSMGAICGAAIALLVYLLLPTHTHGF